MIQADEPDRGKPGVGLSHSHQKVPIAPLRNRNSDMLLNSAGASLR